jgi:hypothetical protein
MKRCTLAILFALTWSLASAPLVAQAPPAAKPATTPPAAPAKLVPPIKGEAELGVLKPQTKRVNNDIVTVVKVKNLSTGSLAGLKIQEYWYDKSNNVVTGNDERVKTPIPPGGVYTFTLKTPYVNGMNQNTYQFTHANGKIKTKQLAKIE